MFICWLFFHLVACKVSAHPADSSLVLYGVQQVEITAPIRYYIDSSGTQDFQQVIHQFFNTPESYFNRKIQQGYNDNYWLHFSLANKADTAQTIYIDAGEAQYVILYQQSGNNLIIKKEGDLLDKSARKPLLEQQTFQATLPAGKVSTFYIFFPDNNTQGISYNGVGVYNISSLYSSFYEGYYDNNLQRILQLLFQGFILCQILYVIFQWFIIHRKEYPYYALYLTMIGLYYAIRYERVIGLFWPFEYYPEWYNYLHPGLLILPYVLYFRFLRSFLEIPARFPIVNSWLRRLEIFLLALTLISTAANIIQWHQNLFASCTDIILFLVFGICVALIVYLLKKKDALIYFILTGSFFAGAGSMLGHVISFLQFDIKVIHGDINILWWNQIGVVLEICCFTMGLSYKSKLDEKEKIQSQKKLIEQLQANEQLQNRMQNIRNKIAQDLHDDIGATLSTILLYSNAAKRKQDNITSAEAQQTFQQICQTASGMMDEMSDIVWAINPKNDQPDKIFQRMYLFASPVLAANNIQFCFEVDEEIKTKAIQMDKRKNLYLVFKEAVNNAVKYASCTRLEVTLSKAAHNMISMRICDNGKGFDLNNVNNGNGLDNMQQRTKEMGGYLKIIAAPGRGASITVTVPLNG